MTQIMNNTSHIKSNTALLPVQTFLRSSFVFSPSLRPPTPSLPPSSLPYFHSRKIDLPDDDMLLVLFILFNQFLLVWQSMSMFLRRSGSSLKVSAISPKLFCILLIYPKWSYEFCSLTSLCSSYYKISHSVSCL